MGELKGTLLRPRLANCECPCDPVLRRLVYRKRGEGGESANPVPAHKTSQVYGYVT